MIACRPSPSDRVLESGPTIEAGKGVHGREESQLVTCGSREVKTEMDAVGLPPVVFHGRCRYRRRGLLHREAVAPSNSRMKQLAPVDYPLTMSSKKLTTATPANIKGRSVAAWVEVTATHTTWSWFNRLVLTSESPLAQYRCCPWNCCTTWCTEVNASLHGEVGTEWSRGRGEYCRQYVCCRQNV